VTTLEEKSQADLDTLVTAEPGPVLDCTVCGRNCKHIPSAAGGGSAGGLKGEKYTPTPRSELRCPACMGKPHRKEGRIYQIIACQYRQAMLRLGATALLHPNEAIYMELAKMASTGDFKETPSDTEFARMVLIAQGITPPEPKRNKIRVTSDVVKQAETKDEVEIPNKVATGGIDIDSLDLPALKPAPENKIKASKKPKKPKKAKAAIAEETEDTGEVTAPITPDEIEIEEGALDTGDTYNPFAGVGMSMPDDDDEEIPLTPEQEALLARK
jgi:hypothetical protein